MSGLPKRILKVSPLISPRSREKRHVTDAMFLITTLLLNRFLHASVSHTIAPRR